SATHVCAATITLQGNSTTGPTNCIPFGGAGPYLPYMGFIYKNVPAFTLAVGEKVAFDLGSPNDQPIMMDIALATAVSNGSDTPNAAGFTTIVTGGIPSDPDGDAIIGNYELAFTATAPFSFSGGGLIVRFHPTGTFATDGDCGQVLMHSDASDSSGLFVER